MRFRVKTRGHCDFIDITERVRECLKMQKAREGICLVFVAGSTVAVTTMEYEEGIKKDIRSVLEKYIPENYCWKHHLKWGDKNGAAHIRSAFIKPSLVVPIEKGELVLGTWQQIVLIDFDEREREREVVVKIIPV